MEKFLTTSVYTFKSIIESNYLYVDKTKYLYDLVKNPQGIYFLSRPRRFGKSMSISTLESIFLGEKELFKGLYIYKQPFKWKKHPVIHLSLNKLKVFTGDELEKKLSYLVRSIAKQYKIAFESNDSASMFDELIMKLSEIDKVVILIDEYDKPILDNVDNKEEITNIKEILKGFYSQIKANDRYLRFVFLTGVSKFSRVSIFSDLNNLDDISMYDDFGSAYGFTQKEVDDYFGDEMKKIAKKMSLSYEDLKEKIRLNYNGYRFCDDNIKVYNHVSIKNFVMQVKFKQLWFETGTPKFLLKLLKKNDYDIINLEALKLNAASFSTYEIENLRPEPILFQTGYLTIKDYNEEDNQYTLSYPNLEVKTAFLEHLTDYFTPVRKELAPNYIVELKNAVRDNKIDKFMKILKVFFANIDYDLQLKYEKYYQTIFYLVFTLIGFRIKAEVKTNDGRIDAVIETNTHTYIFEFKLFDTSKNAMKQIEDKKYYEKYLLNKKQIVLIGVGFDAETNNLKEDYIVKEL